MDERLEVYRAALDFHRDLLRLSDACDAMLRVQVRRASSDVVRRVAHTVDPQPRGRKQRSHRRALSSVAHSLAIVDMLHFEGHARPVDCDRARSQLVRIADLLAHHARSAPRAAHPLPGSEHSGEIGLEAT
jgi:hypothetical protein